jgi:hypothetical protein
MFFLFKLALSLNFVYRFLLTEWVGVVCSSGAITQMLVKKLDVDKLKIDMEANMKIETIMTYFLSVRCPLSQLLVPFLQKSE